MPRKYRKPKGPDWQKEPGEAKWIGELRRKAFLYDHVIPRMQRDLAIDKAKVNRDDPAFELWLNSYSARVDSGEAEWDARQVADDAARYSLADTPTTATPDKEGSR